MKKKNPQRCQEDGNVFLFPELPDRLLRKAMDCVEAKAYKQARNLFGQLLTIDSHNQKGLYGWTVCSIELGDYRSAEEAIMQLMDEETDHFADVFRLYLTLLIEKKDYRRALHEINHAAGDQKFAEMGNFLQNMKTFCLQRLDESAPAEQTDCPADWVQRISNHELILTEADLPAVQRFLLDPDQDQESKTLLLCAVQKENLSQTLTIRKFGKIYSVTFNQDFLNRLYSEQIVQLIEDKLSAENPTLANLAKQLVHFFMVHIFPVPVDSVSREAWAAFFVSRAASAAHSSEERQTIGSKFAVTDKEYEQVEAIVQEAERSPEWPTD